MPSRTSNTYLYHRLKFMVHAYQCDLSIRTRGIEALPQRFLINSERDLPVRSRNVSKRVSLRTPGAKSA